MNDVKLKFLKRWQWQRFEFVLFDETWAPKYYPSLTFLAEILQDLVSAFKYRGITYGKAMYQELTGNKKPMLDKNNILHWPVLLLYPEVMSSDIIEDFCETDMFSVHLDMISLQDIFSVECFSLYDTVIFLCYYLVCGQCNCWVNHVILSFQTCSQRVVHLCLGIQKMHTLVMLLSCTMR